MTEPADRELLDGIRQGRREACAELIRRHYAGRLPLPGRTWMPRDAAEAEDLTQETFAAAWEKIAAFEGRSALGTWLHRIAYGKFIDARRAGRALGGRWPGGCGRASAPPPLCPVEAAARGDEARRLYAALDRVDPSDRVLLVLHYFQGLSYREMADVTGEPAGTIKWRTSLALRRMRDLLTAEESHVP